MKRLTSLIIIMILGISVFAQDAKEDKKAIKELIGNHNLIDIWREIHPDKNKFTRRKFNTAQGRLDYFIISQNLQMSKNTVIY